MKAQSTSSLSGQILSATGESVAEANIYLSASKWAVSNSDGSFQIPSLPPGEYTIKVSRVGFKSASKMIEIEEDKNAFIEIILEEIIYESGSAVVTATRTVQDIEDVSIAVDVISEDEIQYSGSTNLKDILLEQAGISLSPNEGNAIQVQGFESDYTLILIDGQPLVGRVRGAMDISRINTSNIQQIEIVKGPSSALWGSDALAGVINIITKKPNEAISGNAFTQYGSRASYNGGATISFNKNKLSGTAGFVIDGSDGFDLDKEEFGQNQNPYDNFTINSSLKYEFSDLTSLSASSRYYKNNFSGLTIASVQGQQLGVGEEGWQDDLSFQLQLDSSPFSRFQTSVNLYSTLYEDYSETVFEDSNFENVTNNNQQGFNKIEVQNNYSWANNHISTFGTGFTKEFVDAERYQGRRNQEGLFLFAQHQFLVGEKLNIVAGARLDNHSSYTSYLSPKLSLRYEIFENLAFKASAGNGFKAPDFRTLYLDFDNAGSGYLIYGVKNIGAQLTSFENQGLVRQYFINPDLSTDLDPEYSTAYNAGFLIKTSDSRLTSNINFFRNNAQNLIEAIEIAELTNNNTIFGYVNINKAQTQGIESDLNYFVTNDLQISLGYQYLDAIQIAQESRTVIENGQVVTKDVEYEIPLTKRPKHSGSIKLFYEEPFFDTQISIRGVLKSKYFFNDSNANRRADSNEFTDPYSIWNFSLSKQFTTKIRAQAGVNNVFNYTNPEFLRFQPGISFFTKILFEF
ncbi:MAG: TonB-dependent receptor [Balneolaceae bacterium]|nr:TonB-dependent receptor [Balneolaceae bacterium]MBO6545847.1 TonB-dependent receptor [Balneolaceae bacterium]MBO6647243.1 TonB-dependent receptor [Balneolaceae bacterium]